MKKIVFFILMCFVCEIYCNKKLLLKTKNNHVSFDNKQNKALDSLGLPKTFLFKPKFACSCILSTAKCNGFIYGNKTHTVMFDIRITNLGLEPVSCPMGEVNCCKYNNNNNNNNMPPKPKKCGERIIASNQLKINDQSAYGAYPWHAEIIDLNNQYIGAGVIIDDSHIITVAHLVYKLENKYKIRLGKWNRTSKTEQFLEVKPLSTKIHEAFNIELLFNDIAIIKIDRKIVFHNYVNINAACLPTAIPPSGIICWTAGWGKNNFTSDKYENILKEIDLPIVDHGTCEKQFQKTRLGSDFKLDSKTFICAGGQLGKDSCTGDGGGALICQPLNGRFEIVGLTAWGIGCGQQNVPGAYVHVYNYLDWLKRNM
ncbi:phenoloxidase-activating factor 2-like [Leptopilina boulardi]|uniref:phenoloxidase-activating factor 2-like n=1 Tax=Leptopilina boulardi TaxID=63433 RepID=UPI0021F5B71C|nr:phenoloxidase-activating factor 2-like [Leptopilina boulardi]